MLLEEAGSAEDGGVEHAVIRRRAGRIAQQQVDFEQVD